MILIVNAGPDNTTHRNLISIYFGKHGSNHEHGKFRSVPNLFFCHLEKEAVIATRIHLRDAIDEFVNIVPSMTLPKRFTVFRGKTFILLDLLITEKDRIVISFPH